MIREAIEKIVNKEDLSYDEAYTVMNEIMNGVSTATQNAAFLAALSTKSARAETRDEMLDALRQSLPGLKKTAALTLRRFGCDDPVEISLGVEGFPTRYYPTFALPAGRYTALRVRLGSAAGHNWWCVCFPGLCSAACVEELDAVAAGAGFSDEELRLITGREPYVIRFKVLEWLESLRRRAAGEA